MDLSRSRRREEQISQELRDRNIRVRSARELKRAQTLLQQRVAHVLLAIPGKRSAAALRTLLESLADIDADVPLVVLTERPTVEEASEAIRGNAYDYLCVDDLGPLWQCLDRIVEDKGFPLGHEEHLSRVLGERLRTTRKEQQLTLQQLAKMTRIP